MKTKILALAVALTTASFAMSAQAAVENSFTFGVKGGYVYHNTSDNSKYEYTDDNGFGYGAYVDYNPLEWLGIELGYTALDGASYKNLATGKTVDSLTQGPELALRLAIPLDAKGSDLFFKAGTMYAFTDHPEDDGFIPLVGLGGQYNFSSGFGIRAGVDYYFNTSEGDGEKYNGLDRDSMLAYIGLQYTFGMPKTAEPPVEPKTVAQEYTENVVLNTGTLFPFDGSELSDSGKQEVAALVSKVEQENVQDAKYVVKGYTDRIGSEQYNQKLSEKRANAVSAEIANNNVAPQMITTEAYGETNSVTGDKCNGLKGNALVECLSPDRRVEINISGTKVTVKQVSE